MGQVDHRDPNIQPLPHPNNGEAMRRYTEQYEYDGVGNILSMIQQANGGSWTRRYQYAADSTRLLATSRRGDTPDGPYADTYEYNLHGSMTRMPHLPIIAWDFAERMQTSSTQVFNNGTPETTYYVYDASGQRVRKITERQAAEGATPIRVKERIYLGSLEIYREYDGSGSNATLERETLHVMDDQQRIALVETKTVESGSIITSPVSRIRYQLGNHLGSASVELDDAGRLLSYEEYHPYGTTSYRAMSSAIEVSAKRYRYTGKEKDEENGLYYHGARYYSPWLGRWPSVDPIPTQSPYTYANNCPVVMLDPDGRSPLIAISALAACGTPSQPPTVLDPVVPVPNPKTFADDAIKSVTDVIKDHNRLIQLTGSSEYIGEKYNQASLTEAERRNVQVVCGCLFFPETSVKAYFESMEANYTQRADELMKSTKNPSLERTLTAGRYKETATKAESDYQTVKGAYERANKAGTAMLRELHDTAGWTTVYFHTGDEDSSVGRYDKVAQKKLYPWTTDPPGSHPEVQVPVDYLINNLEEPAAQDPTSATNLEALLKVPYAIGVVDSGMHTFMLSYGRVYEVHWGGGPGPNDPTLFEVSDLKDFMSNWTSGVVAIPTELLREENINFNP
jgi:RHS repeat-associated protein